VKLGDDGFLTKDSSIEACYWKCDGNIRGEFAIGFKKKQIH